MHSLLWRAIIASGHLGMAAADVLDGPSGCSPLQRCGADAFLAGGTFRSVVASNNREAGARLGRTYSLLVNTTAEYPTFI